VTHPEGSRAVKIGVLLPRQTDDLGEWLADASAFEAAGADALWVDFASEPELDPLALTAALAAVTVRPLLVTTLPTSDGPSEALARMLATIGRLSHGRLRIVTDAIPVGALAETPVGGLAETPVGGLAETRGGRLAEIVAGLGTFRRIPGDPEAFEHMREPDEVERWVSASSPDGRATWRATLRDAAESGAQGLVVPIGPRLLDILRNPDDPGHRRDLQLAQG